jgi:hypothetical protein
LKARYDGKVLICVVGEGAAAVLAAYAALWVPEVLGMLAPRSATIYAETSPPLEKVAQIYAAAEAMDRLAVRSE